MGLGQAIIQGLATGFTGDELATDLTARKLQLTEAQRRLQAEQEQTSANKVWSKAIMDLLAGKQTGVTPPTAPQPGQAVTPPTQTATAAADPTARGQTTPTSAGLGGPTNPYGLAPPGTGADADAKLADIEQRESGGQNIPNAQGSDASGYYQIRDGTWAEFNTQYKRAMDAPKDVQDQVAKQIFAKYGEQPWLASNPKYLTAQKAPATQAAAAAQPSPAQATAQAMGTSLVPPAPPSFSQMSASDILAKIKQDNPNLSPGVLSSIVDDHLMPYMDQQQQASYKQFQQYFEMSKLNQTEQDRANQLYFRYQALQDNLNTKMQQLQQQQQIADANRQSRQDIAAQADETKKQIAAQADATKREMDATKKQLADVRQRLMEQQIKESQAREAKDRQAGGAVVRLPAAEQARLGYLKAQASGLTSQINNAHNNGETDRENLLQDQLTAVQKQINELLDKAETAQAQGKPQQPKPSPGDPAVTADGHPATTVPADKPVRNILPDVWKTYSPAKQKLLRDFQEALDAETTQAGKDKVMADYRQKLVTLNDQEEASTKATAPKPLGQ